MVKGHRTNHILHLILTLITLGIWAIVWIAMAIFGGEKRKASRSTRRAADAVELVELGRELAELQARLRSIRAAL